MYAQGWLGVMFVLAGCDGLAQVSPSGVHDLRVLALTTATPEVRPGRLIRIEAAIMDPLPVTQPVVRWRVCDESEIPDPRACAAADGGIDLGFGPGVEVPAWAVSATRSLVVLAAVCRGAPAEFDTSLGHFACAGGAPAAEAFRRLVVHAKGKLNRPPEIERWELVRGALVVRPEASGEFVLPRCDRTPCGAWTVRVVPNDRASEVTAGVPEALVASFYATAGTIDPPRDAAAPGEVRPMTSRWIVADGLGSPQVGVVLRDQRGGESVRIGRVAWR